MLGCGRSPHVRTPTYTVKTSPTPSTTRPTYRTRRSSFELSRRPNAATAPRKTASAAHPNAANVAQGWVRAIRPTRSPVIASAVSSAPIAGSAARRNRAAPCASFPTGRNLGMSADATPGSLRNDQESLRILEGTSTGPRTYPESMFLSVFAATLALAPATFVAAPGWHARAGQIHACPGGSLASCRSVFSWAATVPWRDCDGCSPHRTVEGLPPKGIALRLQVGVERRPPQWLKPLSWPPRIRGVSGFEGLPRRIGVFQATGLVKGFE